MKTEFIQTIDNIETKKKISIYELLGLIKDGKAPKKIKYAGYTFVYTGDGRIQRYYVMENQENYLLRDMCADVNSEVEIIEPVEDEFIDIEELEIFRDNTFYNWKTVSENRRKINDLIKNQKVLINKLKEEGK